VNEANDEALSVSDLTSDQIGQIAFDTDVVLFELTPQRASLEDVFMELTADSVEYGSSGARNEQ
jgi:ABC-2 type transport system ATP-binding protein